MMTNSSPHAPSSLTGHIARRLTLFGTTQAVGFIVLLGGLLRFWGIGFGLPHFEHPDEWALLMPAVRILQTGDLNPQRFDYGSFYIYIQTAVVAVTSLILRLNGQLPDLAALPIYTPTHLQLSYPYAQIFLTGRLMTAMLGTATIFPAYLIGKEIGSIRMGITAAFIFAIWPLHVIDSHFVTTDVPLTFFITWTLYVMLLAYKKEKTRLYLAAGFLLGLTISTKYTGAFMIVVFVLGHFLVAERPWRKVPLLAAAGLTALIGFSLTTPYWIFDFDNFFYWVTYVTETYNPPIQTIDGGSGRFYLQMLFGYPEILVVLLALLGTIGRYQRPYVGIWLGVGAAFFLFLVSRNVLHQHRVLIPLTPFISLLAAGGLTVLGNFSKPMQQFRLRWPGNEKAVYIILAGVIALPVMWKAVGHSWRFNQPGVRAEARVWIMDNLPDGARASADFDTPVVESERIVVDRVGWSIVQYDPTWYIENGYSHLIVSSSQRFSPNRSAEQEEKYVALLENGPYRLIKEVEGHILSYPDHKILIYERIP